MKRIPVMTVSLLLMAFIAFTATAQSDQANKRRIEGPPLVTMKFPGGTAADYVAAIKTAAGDVNIVPAVECEDVPVPAVELTDASIEAALSVLQGRKHQKGDALIELAVHDANSGQPGEQQIFNVIAISKNFQRPMPPQLSRVWSIAGIAEARVKPEDVLTAIQTSLDLLGDGSKPAQIKFHKETNLIIARGSPEQIDSIDEVVRQLAMRNEQTHALKQCQSDNESLRKRIESLEKEIAEAKKR